MKIFNWLSSFFFKIHGASAHVLFSLFGHKSLVENLVYEGEISLLVDKVSLSLPNICHNIESRTYLKKCIGYNRCNIINPSSMGDHKIWISYSFIFAYELQLVLVLQLKDLESRKCPQAFDSTSSYFLIQLARPI